MARSTGGKWQTAMKYRIFFPSGLIIQREGVLKSYIPDGSHLMHPYIDPGQPAEILLLDPRVMIIDASGTRVFTGCTKALMEADTVRMSAAPRLKS